MARQIGVVLLRKEPVSKRTSIGGRFKPKNKHKRKAWKKYRGQGRP